jgi:hypothetical protein
MVGMSKDPEKRAKQLAALRPWNETGASKAPRGMKITDHLKKIMESKVIKSKITEDFVKEHCPNATNAEALAIMLSLKAMSGNLAAMREVLDRMEGKSVQQVQLTGADGGPIDVTSTTRNAIISKLIPEAAAGTAHAADSKLE